MTPTNGIYVLLSEPQIKALIAAGNRVLTDDPDACGKVHAGSIAAATERLGTAITKERR